jgi:signal transduction histidine kinase
MNWNAMLLPMQFTVIGFLVVASWFGGKAFGRKRLILIAIGWTFNLLYLVASALYEPIIGRQSGFVTVLPRVFDVLGGACFAFATLGPNPAIRGSVRRIPLSLWALALLGTINIVFLISFPESVVTPAGDPFGVRLFVAIVAIGFHMWCLWLLAGFYGSLITGYRTGGDSIVLLPLGTYLYAIIQLLYLAAVLAKPEISQSVQTFGFALGLVAKVTIATGYLRLFISDISRSEADRTWFDTTRNMMARINHEIGTPLAEMRAHIGGLQRERGREHLHEHVVGLEDAMLRVAAILEATRDVEAWSTITTTSETRSSFVTTVPEMRVANANVLVQQAVLALKTTRGNRGVEWEYEYSANCCIRCARPDIVQVLINLLRNAYDSFPDGHGWVRVRTKNIVDDQTKSAYVLITVRDNGEGIRAELSERVWQQGFSTRHGQGRGFGLAVVKDLVARNHGTLEMTSPIDPNSEARPGTEILLRFPRVSCGDL